MPSDSPRRDEAQVDPELLQCKAPVPLQCTLCHPPPPLSVADLAPISSRRLMCSEGSLPVPTPHPSGVSDPLASVRHLLSSPSRQHLHLQ